MYNRRSAVRTLPSGAIWYFTLAGAERAYLIVQNNGGLGAVSFSIFAQYNPTSPQIYASAAIAAGAFDVVTFPNDNKTPPIPLPDGIILFNGGPGTAQFILSVDYGPQG